MTKIITITLNPSIDKSSSFERLNPDQKLRCRNTIYTPGGGGINVSRVVKRLGGKTTALFMAGGDMGNSFLNLIRQEGIQHDYYAIENETRECLILLEELTSNQYLFDMEGPEVVEKEWRGFLDMINHSGAADFIVASGSLPPGVPVDFYGQVAAIAKRNGSKFILDTTGPALQIALDEGVYLIKPNLKELGLQAGLNAMNIETAQTEAQKIVWANKCEVVVVSMGAAGALLVNKDTSQHIPPPPAKQVGTVGAGDSMVAGIVHCLSQNSTLSEAVRYGVACGTATTTHPGTSLCNKPDVERLYAVMGN